MLSASWIIEAFAIYQTHETRQSLYLTKEKGGSASDMDEMTASKEPAAWLHFHGPPTWLQLESVVPIGEVEKVTSLSRDAILKHYKHLCVKLSTARWGMKLRNALAIADGTARQQ